MAEKMSFYEQLNTSRKKHLRVNDASELETSSPVAPKLSPGQLLEFRTNLQPLFSYIKCVSDEHPEMTNRELYSRIETLLGNLNFQYANSPSFRSDSIRVDLCVYFGQHIPEFRELYKQMIEEEKETGVPIFAPEILTYSSNMDVAKKQLMSQLIYSFRRIKNSYDNQDFLKAYAKASPKQKREIRAAQSNKGVRDYLQTSERFFGPELAGMEFFLKDQTQFLSGELKNDYIESILRIDQQLKLFGLLDKYLYSHNKQIDLLHLSDFEISREELDEIYGNLSRETLLSLSINQLSSLNAFWINRLTKEILKFNTAFYTINDLNLWQAIRDASSNSSTTLHSLDSDDPEEISDEESMLDVPITDEQIEALVEKMNFLSYKTSEVITANLRNVTTDELSIQEIENPVTGQKSARRSAAYRDLSTELDVIEAEIGDDYSTYFSRLNNGALSSSENNFCGDIDTYHTAENIKHNSYILKDNIMISQLFTLFNANSFSKNWGLSLEKNSKPHESDKVLIAVDVPGLNMPLRLHIRRELLEDFLRANQKTTKIPLYQGEKEFYKKGRKTKFITTPLLMPLSQKIANRFKKFASSLPETHPYYNFAQHLAYLADGCKSMPKHLKDNPTSKKKGAKAKFVKRYYDFADGKIYKEVSDGKFVEDTEYVIGGKEHEN